MKGIPRTYPALAFALAMLLVLCQMPLPGSAFAANDKTTSQTNTQSKSLSAGTDSDKNKDDKKSKEDKKAKDKKAKEKEAEQKRSEASKLFAQASSMNSNLSAAQAQRAAAEGERDQALLQRDEANERLSEEAARLETLQSELSGFVVDMYKQGGVTPYLDVLLRSTSYREFLNSWNALILVYERGEALAEEKRAVQRQIEEEVAACEERITEAERSIAIADAKCKQIEAAQLALTAQGCDINVEAAKIIGDKSDIKKAESEASKAHQALENAIAQGGFSGANSEIGDGIFAHPCPGSTVSSGFGYRSFDKSVHKGIDMAAPEGTPYYAADSGTVTAVTNGGGYNGGAGNWIVIDHGDGLVTKYMHSLVTFVSVGDRVERGQNIGLVGTTGNSTGPHLHFQVEANGTAVNPAPFLQGNDG